VRTPTSRTKAKLTASYRGRNSWEGSVLAGSDAPSRDFLRDSAAFFFDHSAVQPFLTCTGSAIRPAADRVGLRKRLFGAGHLAVTASWSVAARCSKAVQDQDLHSSAVESEAASRSARASRLRSATRPEIDAHPHFEGNDSTFSGFILRGTVGSRTRSSRLFVSCTLNEPQAAARWPFVVKC